MRVSSKEIEGDELKMIPATKIIYATTIRSAIATGIKISELVKHDFEAFNNIFSTLITMTSISMKVKEKPTTYDIFEFSTKVISEYGFFTIEELAKCLQMGKAGAFGLHYNKFDIETFGNWISEYDYSPERAEALHQINNSFTDTTKPEGTEYVAASEFKKLHDQLQKENTTNFQNIYAVRKIQREKFIESVKTLCSTSDKKELETALHYLQNDTEASAVVNAELLKRLETESKTNPQGNIKKEK